MDDQEAVAVLRDHLRGYRRRKYAELRALLDEPQVAEVRGPSGAAYQLEVVVHWDDRPGGPLRVLGFVDDGGLRALKPLGEGFILTSDETFVGE